MTVRELIRTLQNLAEADKDLEVVTEGCDCSGDVAKVEVIREEGEKDLCFTGVVLRRSDGFIFD